MHNRRARPTVRLLTDDLTGGWLSPVPRRNLSAGDLDALHPMSELPHPLIAKALDCFGEDPERDHPVGPIAAGTTIRLLEIKAGQWRGGVWQDPSSGVCWLVVAGLAKGEHLDHDDFYQRVERDDDPTRWLPGPADERLLKRETAARLTRDWELLIQKAMLEALRSVATGGTTTFRLPHPLLTDEPLAELTLEITPVREPGYQADDVGLTIDPDPKYAAGPLIWRLTIRALTSLSPPEQGWDRYHDSYSNIGEPGSWATRADELDTAVANDELLMSEPGRRSHYTHRKHLVAKTVEGRAVPSLCGVYFVPAQDHRSSPVCPECESLYNDLPN